MIREVWPDRATWNALPWKFEAGTPNISGAIGLAASIEYLERLGMEAIGSQCEALRQEALKGLSQLDGVTLYGPVEVENRIPVVAFNCKGIHPHDLAAPLDEDGIAVRAGHHCAQLLMRRLGVAGTVRASFYLYNTPDEVQAFIQSLEKAMKFLRTACLAK